MRIFFLLIIAMFTSVAHGQTEEDPDPATEEPRRSGPEALTWVEMGRRTHSIKGWSGAFEALRFVRFELGFGSNSALGFFASPGPSAYSYF